MLRDRFKNKETGFLFYGMTPPKLTTEDDRLKEVAAKQIERIKRVPIDGLVLYDVQDESARTDVSRPFPYMATLAPDVYSDNYLQELDVPKIIYKSIGKFNRDSFTSWINKNSDNIDCCVLVGAASKSQAVSLSLHDAYKIKAASGSSLMLGGVTIPERHVTKKDEHIRIFDKIDNGCGFFISQCVYSVNNAKDFLSDYYYSSLENNRELKPVIFTLTPCGSMKTLEFMNWLGIDIPNWLKNELKHSEDFLAKSVKVCEEIAAELIEYCKNKNMPIGFNIESVSIRKEEIEASIELLKSVKRLMEK